MSTFSSPTPLRAMEQPVTWKEHHHRHHHHRRYRPYQLPNLRMSNKGTRMSTARNRQGGESSGDESSGDESDDKRQWPRRQEGEAVRVSGASSSPKPGNRNRDDKKDWHDSTAPTLARIVQGGRHAGGNRNDDGGNGDEHQS